MTLAQTYSWLFYALAIASRIESEKYQVIEQTADGINHAIPTQQEVWASMSWLILEGLIYKDKKKYALSEKGNALLNKTSNGICTAQDTWKSIEIFFENMGVDNIVEINPSAHAT